MKLIDTHAHLLKESYEHELEKVLKDSSNELLEVWNIAWNLETSKEVISTYKKNKSILPVIGIHPNHANEFNNDQFLELDNLIKFEKPIAIGEIGLDYFHDYSNKQEQEKAFNMQLELAKKYNLPVIIHSRQALDDVWNKIKHFTNNFLIHSVAGELKIIKEMSRYKNLFFSFNGILTFKNAKDIKEIFNHLPKEKILVETDCPWLTPEPFRGQKNYPKMVNEVALYISKQWNIDINETIKILNNNAKRFISNKS